MSAQAVGRIGWGLKRDRDGHRDYNLRMLVETTDPADGPSIVYWAGGLPAIGSSWTFGNDDDPWAFCSPEATVTPAISVEPCTLWYIDIPFTTKPFRRCQDTNIENPLDEPYQVGGSFVKYTRELRRRADDNSLILNSAHQQIEGLEKDANRPTVRISQNVPDLQLNIFAQMVDTTNDAPLWNLTERMIKLDNVSWTRKVYGTCFFYYTRELEFSIRYETFDIVDFVDAGWMKFDSARFTDNPANRADPTKYIVAKDGRGENIIKMLLDGNGDPLTDPTSPVLLDPIQVYGTSNFLLLDVPTSF